MSATITDKAREELEGALMLIISNVREYRDREQQHLSDPQISISELMQTMGTVIALKNVSTVLDMVAQLYGLEV